MKQPYIRLAPSRSEQKDPPLTVEVADSFWPRFKGLMLRKNLSAHTGLLITPCNSIHMCFMRFKLDIVFLSEDMEILKITANVWPWVGMSMCLKAKSALELPAGTAAEYNLAVGEKLTVAEQN